MIKKFLAALGVVTAAGAPAIYAAAAPAPGPATDAVAPTTSSQQLEDTITCPLTGEEISPCCCPLNDK